MTSDFDGFSFPDFIHYTYLNSWERASIFPFECSMLNKGTTGTILITSLNPGPPALEAITIPLGYRGGGNASRWTYTHIETKTQCVSEVKIPTVYIRMICGVIYLFCPRPFTNYDWIAQLVSYISKYSSKLAVCSKLVMYIVLPLRPKKNDWVVTKETKRVNMLNVVFRVTLYVIFTVTLTCTWESVTSMCIITRLW